MIIRTLVGADFTVTTVEQSRTRAGRFFRWRCSCPRQGGDWTRDTWLAQDIAEVHARLWHGAEPDRGRWRGPNHE